MTALSNRETDVMRLVCEGFTAQGIGEALGISSRTVEVHRRGAIRKLGARNQTHAAVLFDRAQREQAAEAEVRRLDYSSIHTCHDQCPRLPCVQRREIEALTAQLAEARESERAAVVAWLRDRKEVSAYYIDYVETAQAADAIEAGEHLK